MGRLGLKDFVSQNTGKRLANPVTGTYPGQCVSLVQQYLDQCLNIPYKARGNAKDWVKSIPAAGLGKISGEQPKFGELVTWDERQGGGYGHIGVALGDGTVFQQNDYFNGHNGTARVIKISTIQTPYITISMNTKPSDMPSTGSGTSPSTGDWVNSSKFGGTYKLNTAALNIRDKPSLKGSVKATYKKNEGPQNINLEGKYLYADGYVWGTYISGSTGERRYVAVGPITGGVDASKDFLLKV